MKFRTRLWKRWSLETRYERNGVFKVSFVRKMEFQVVYRRRWSFDGEDKDSVYDLFDFKREMKIALYSKNSLFWKY